MLPLPLQAQGSRNFLVARVVVSAAVSACTSRVAICAAMAEGAHVLEPDALDQKGNCYYRRKLVQREFLGSKKDLMRLTFELPQRCSLSCLGFDIGLGDFVRIRPYTEEHKKLVENPAGGRAYSPVFPPEVDGKFGFIIKAYGPGDKVVGVSSLLQRAPLGSEFLVTDHVEHVFWEQRNRGYYCNQRNIELGNEGPYNVGLIAFGIGITEIAPVAMSELRDPRVKQVTILWANKYWSDAKWAWTPGNSGEADDLVHQFFASQEKYGSRLHIKHVLSQEEHPEACFHGRVDSEILKKTFLADDSPTDNMKFLAVGTTAMIDFAYAELAGLGLDVSKKDHWGGANLLYRKLAQSSAPEDRRLSPLLAATNGACCKRQPDTVDESPSKRPKL
jgi:NAD(P)H-flavin reductase